MTTPQTPPPLNGLTRAELESAFARQNIPIEHAGKIFQAMQRNGVSDPAKIEHISAAARKAMEAYGPPRSLELDQVHKAEDGTIKLRLKTAEGLAIESVLIPARERTTLCVSSQVGCAAACAFCHTGTMGLLRNLETWEIIDQFTKARGISERPITNIVFMGMGEPLHNEARVVAACQILNDPLGAGFPKRKIVVSTAGVGQRIRPFWEQDVASVSLSLHATTNEARDKIVPLNKQYNLEALKQILLDIPWRHRETVTIAYLLLEDVNDTVEDAERLAEWTRGLPVKVNLLEFNPFPGNAFKRASTATRERFRLRLKDFGLFNTLRRSRGEDAMAACGQLAIPGQRRTPRAPAKN